MNTSRIRTSHAYGETPANTFSDFEWVREHRGELLEQYGECIILVYEKEVIGIGDTIQEAEENAERNLSPDVEEVTPITEILRHRHPFLRVRPQNDR